MRSNDASSRESERAQVLGRNGPGALNRHQALWDCNLDYRLQCWATVKLR